MGRRLRLEVLRGLDDYAHNRLYFGWPGKLRRVRNYGKYSWRRKCWCAEIKRLERKIDDRPRRDLASPCIISIA